MNQRNILLVDDDPALLRLLSIRLEAFGYRVRAVTGGVEALTALDSFEPNVVITDLRMDDLDGLSLLDEMQQRYPDLPVLLITAHGSIPDAVAATQRGAFDFLAKPIESAELLRQIEQALIQSGLSRGGDEDWSGGIVSRSPSMETLLARARLVADADTSILITGAAGTGKELLARAIHRAGRRREGEFVALDCVALPEQPLELSSHPQGTGSQRPGLFLAADGGTLFLDKIDHMPPYLQARLLRLLQERHVRRSHKTRPVDIRIISATRSDLLEAVRAGRFREDLYYRLNLVQLSLPSLAERREDIPLLAAHQLGIIARRRQEPRKRYSAQAMERLIAADWPDNVRQLINVVEQNAVLCPASVIGPHLVEQALGESTQRLLSFNEAREVFGRNYLAQLLRLTQGNVSRAARLAGRNRTDFYKLLSKHQVDPTQFKSG